MPWSRPSLARVRGWLAEGWELPERPRLRPLAGGFTSHVWRIDVGTAAYVARLGYQPRDDVDNGLRAAAILARHGLRSGPAVLTRDGALTCLVEHPAGRWHPLALLRFVAGEPLDWRAPGALRSVGHTLGTVHRVLLEDGSLDLPERVFGYLLDDTIWGRQAALEPLIRRAVAAARAFETQCPVTYGPIYGDGLQLRVDGRDGSIGLIDWGTVCRGPLLFDLALAAHHAGQVDLSELWAGYLAVGPLQPAELAGLRHYEALMWARSAKYFAFRLEHRVRLGDARRGANQAALARAVSALQRLLGVEGGFAPLESL